MIRTVLCLAAMLGIWPNAAVAATVSDAGPPRRASVVGDRRQACVGRCDEHRPLFRSVPTIRWDRRRRCEHDRLRAFAPAHRHHGPDSAADPHRRQRRRSQLAPRSTGTAREDCGGFVGARSAPLHGTRLWNAAADCRARSQAQARDRSQREPRGPSKAALESPGICWTPAASPTQWERMTTMLASSVVRGSSKSAAFAIRLWVSRPDGSWRATLKSLAVNTQHRRKTVHAVRSQPTNDQSARSAAGGRCWLRSSQRDCWDCTALRSECSVDIATPVATLGAGQHAVRRLGR